MKVWGMEYREKDWNDFGEIQKDIWHMLVRGAQKYNDPFHTPAFGTTGENGCSMRVVVLRKVFPSERRLVFHTDARAGKVWEIRDNPRVSWLFYHPGEKVQLRVSGLASLHENDALADRQWRHSQLMSRRCYCSSEAPGAITSEPKTGLPEHLVTRIPTEEESEMGRTNFLVVSCRVDRIEWLYLRALGHVRAQFDWGEENLKTLWMIP